MSSHIQICPVLSQLELMASELLVGWKIKHRFKWNSRQAFNNFEDFNQITQTLYNVDYQVQRPVHRQHVRKWQRTDLVGWCCVYGSWEKCRAMSSSRLGKTRLQSLSGRLDIVSVRHFSAIRRLAITFTRGSYACSSTYWWMELAEEILV